MRCSNETVKADIRMRTGPPHRQSVAEISQELRSAGSAVMSPRWF